MTKPSKRWIWVGIGIAVLTGFIGFLAWRFPGTLDGRDSKIRLVHATLLLSVFLIPSLFYQQIKARQAIKSALIWIGLGLILFTGYAYRDEASSVFRRLSGELIPQSAHVSGGMTTVRIGRDGHYRVEASVDGQLISFLIDTGASDVVLSPNDARRLGFDLDKLNYSKIYQTANGTITGAPVRLGLITIGSVQMINVSASVNGADMNQSLLGMSFLNRLSGFEIKGNSLIMKP